MSRSTLTPVRIFRAYRSKTLSLRLAVDYLISYIDEAVKDQRFMALKFLSKLPLNERSFEYVTKLAISEKDNNLRALAGKIVSTSYFERSIRAIQWIIENNTSIKVFANLYKSLKNIHSDPSDKFISNIINKIAEVLKLVSKEVIFVLELFSVKRLHYYSWDMIIDDNDCLTTFISYKLSDYDYEAYEGNSMFIIDSQHIICLNLSGLKLDKLPHSIGSLSQLKILNLEKNDLIDLPEEIGFLSSLRELDLGWNYFSTLPECCSTLPDLKVLRIASNFHTFKRVSEAMWIIAQYCYIRDYISEGVNPSEAPVLSLFEMMLSSKLTKLGEYYNNFNEVNLNFFYGVGSCSFYAIDKLGHVTGIYIHGNMDLRDTVCIPKYIHYLKYLVELSMINCFIYEVPEEIGQLSHLRRINLSVNYIKSIPKSLQFLPNLVYLDLSWNPISDDIRNYNFMNKDLEIKIGYLRRNHSLDL